MFLKRNKTRADSRCGISPRCVAVGERLFAEFSRNVVLCLEFPEFLHQFVGDFFRAGFPVDVVHLGRVGFEVVELPFVVDVEVHQFVSLCFDAVVSTDAVESGKFVVVVVKRFSPIFRRFARFDESAERLSLHIVGDVDSAHVEKGGCEVDVLC